MARFAQGRWAAHARRCAVSAVDSMGTLRPRRATRPDSRAIARELTGQHTRRRWSWGWSRVSGMRRCEAWVPLNRLARQDQPGRSCSLAGVHEAGLLRSVRRCCPDTPMADHAPADNPPTGHARALSHAVVGRRREGAVHRGACVANSLMPQASTGSAGHVAVLPQGALA